ncbi:hypothetical protein [Aureivirga marina]|uniref:hypothetical protein n=1 Tax=Aureivirga marina TaxID=1182451 RepID=UPI0018C9F90E|nr:hypothetical protein [Aureivirga marina]
MKNEILIPEVSKNFEKFDIESYNKEKTNGQVRKREHENFIILIDYSNGYSQTIYDDKSYFHTVKNFYLNGNIEIKGNRFNNGSECGIWYEFDENGKLLKEFNMDEGFDFNWLDVMNYCLENEIQLEKGYPVIGGVKTEIYKGELNGRKIWTVSYYDFKKNEYLEITLDGISGKKINSKKLELIGG